MDHSEQLARGAVLITVNQRLARHHMARYQRAQWARGMVWWDTPLIMPMRSWVRSLHAQALAQGNSTRTLLPDLLQRRAWRRCIEQDTALELLDIEAATQSARQAWEIACAWQCPNLEDDYLSLDQFTWQRWQSRYQAFLDRENVVDEASLADHLREIISADVGGDLLPSTLILEGFLQLPPQLQVLINAIQAKGTYVEITQRSAAAYVHHISYADDVQELLGIANAMRCELERDANQSLGLVVPDLHMRRAVVQRAFDRVFFPASTPDQIRDTGRPYDLSIGLSLAETAIINSGLLVLKLCLSSLEGSELSALLLSPYLTAAGSESRRRERMDRRLREQRIRSLDLAALLEHLHSESKLVSPIKRLLKLRKLSRATFSEWAGRFSQWMKLLGWPGDGMDTEEYQAVTAWMECLDDLQLLDDDERVSASEAFALLNRLARERIFQLDTPETPIQIMGRLESHGIAFDCLWVAGLDTEQWPPVGSPSPFLSIANQKTAGVPDASATARLALAESEFIQWSSQSPLLIASHALLRDGKELEVAHIPSVLASAENSALAMPRIERLDELLELVDPVSVLQESLKLESIIDDYGPALPAGSEVRGGARLFENQALCPFRAFALHRLRVKPLEEAGLGLDPRQHGTLLHHALELFWRTLCTQEAMLALDPDALDAHVVEAIDKAIVEQAVPAELIELERARLSQLIKEWLVQCEAPRQAFEVVSLEQRQSLEHGGIVMNVMLDRIDRVAGSLVVVDYKTGTSNKVNTWADERIVNPQLPLYVLTNEEIQGACFAQVARNQCGFKGVASDATLLPGVKTTVSKSRSGEATTKELEQWSDWRAHWRESLDKVALEVRQGLATVTPMKTACNHCELKSLCRIGGELFSEEDEEAGVAGSSGVRSTTSAVKTPVVAQDAST